MRIATFNVENLDEPLGTRALVLRPALARLAADVLCLQEVNGQHVRGEPERRLLALDALVAGTPYAAFHRAHTTSPGKQGPADVHNLVTLSRFPITATRQILHDYVPPPEVRLLTADPPKAAAEPIRFDRAALMTEIALDGRRLVVINVHLRAPLAAAIPGGKSAPFTWRDVGTWAEGFYLSGLKRNAQALELRLLVDELFDADPAPAIVVTGDFNAEDGATPLKIIAGAPEDTGNGALAYRSLVPLERAIPADRRFSVLHHGRPQLLDHLLVSHALLGAVRIVEIHNEALGDEAMAYERDVAAGGSYHAPIVAAFDLPARED